MKTKNYLFYAVGLLALIFTFLAPPVAAGLTLAIATTGGMFHPSVQIFRENLGEKVGYDTWWRGRWSELMSFIDHKKFKASGRFAALSNSKAPGEAIIHVVRDFEKGGLNYEFPMRHPLTGQGRTGSQVLTGHGEDRKITTQKLLMNMRRHAVNVRDNELSEQVISKKLAVQLLESGADDLRDWFSRLFAFEPMFAVVKGYCNSVTDANYGRNVSAKSHPNFYVQGDGKVSWSSSHTFDAGYETNVATALGTLSDTSSKRFDSQAIRDMVFLAANTHRIPKIKYGGREGYMIFVTPSHMRQLRKDTDWLSAMKDAASRGKDNQIFTGMMEGYWYEGAWLIEDPTIPACRVSGDSDTSVYGTAYDSNEGTVNYGIVNFLATPMDVSPRKLAILVGAGAVMAANVKGFKLTTEITDHEQKIEDGGRMFYGFQRADKIDDENVFGNGAGTLYENTTSLVWASWTPTTITI